MESVLVDTDVFSWVLKRDTRAGKYKHELSGRELCLSFMTVAELRLWAIRTQWGESRRRSLEAAINDCLLIHSDDPTATLWARITATSRASGRPIGCADAWIAATALRHDLPLVTNNRTDFEGIAHLRIITRD